MTIKLTPLLVLDLVLVIASTYLAGTAHGYLMGAKDSRAEVEAQRVEVDQLADRVNALSVQCAALQTWRQAK